MLDQILADSEGPMSDEIAARIDEVLGQARFGELPTDEQLGVFARIRAAHGSSSHPSALSHGRAMAAQFRQMLARPDCSLAAALGAYDCCYHLYWCATNSALSQRGFDAEVVMPLC